MCKSCKIAIGNETASRGLQGDLRARLFLIGSTLEEICLSSSNAVLRIHSAAYFIGHLRPYGHFSFTIFFIVLIVQGMQFLPVLLHASDRSTNSKIKFQILEFLPCLAVNKVGIRSMCF